MLLLQGGDDGAKKDPASSANPGALEAEIKERGGDSKPARARKEREARVPEHLPAVDEVIEPEEVTAAPKAWRHIGEEVTEQLDCQPARFLRRRIIRRKYVKRDEPHLAPIIAALNTLQERSIAAPGLLAQIIVAKYCDHLPLYRQEQNYATRHDIHIPRQSMARWLGLAADWLRPIYEHIHTGRAVPGAHHPRGLHRHLAVRRLPGLPVLCQAQRRPHHAGGVLGARQAQVYSSLPPSGQPVGCLSHFCRLHEAMESAPQHAGWLLLQIQHLYRIEQQLRLTKAGPRQRQAQRAAESRMIVERIHRALTLLKRSGRHLPKSAIGRAIDYALTHWTMLCVYLEDGRIEIDNNPVERAIRPTAVGKKNWLFIGEAEAGQRSAVLFTIIEACRSRCIDPQTYLSDVLTRLPTMTNPQTQGGTPAAWVKAQEQAAQRQAA